MAEKDVDLGQALKQAKAKKMYFAFIPKGAADGKLIIKKVKVPVKEIAAAQEELGVKTKPITGRCSGPLDGMTFLTVKPAPGTMKAALKVVTKRDAGMPVIADLQVAADADAEEAEATGTAAAEATAPVVARAAPVEAAPPSTAKTARPSEPGPDASERPTTEQELVVLEDRRRDFKKARAAWVAVKIKAEEDLEMVKDGARMAYLADASQFPKIVKGCEAIDDILDNLDDQLRDTLDQYASASLKNQTKLRSLAATATEILDRYLKYVEANPIMKAIDSKEFADVAIHAPIKRALVDLRKALS